MEARLENLLEQASKKEPSYADFLDECWAAKWMRAAAATCGLGCNWRTCRSMKTFDQFDFGFQPSIDERQIRELRSLRFIHEASNVIFLGPPGVGKTH